MNKYILAAVCTILAATISLTFSGNKNTEVKNSSNISGFTRSGFNPKRPIPNVYPTFGAEDEVKKTDEKPYKEGEVRYPAVKAFEEQMIQLSAKANRSCVRIFSFSKPKEGVSQDYNYVNFSGVIVRKDGFILTLAQPLTSADSIIVNIGKNNYTANIWAIDDESRLGIIKIEAKDLPEIAFADPSKIKPGSLVVLSGNPYGLNNSVKYTSVSGTDRVMYINGKPNYGIFQIDTSTSPGEPGGPCLNSDGELMGIVWSSYFGEERMNDEYTANKIMQILDRIIKPEMKTVARQVIVELLHELTAKYSYSALQDSDKISFVLPSDSLKKISDNLVKYKKIKKAFVGIKIAHNGDLEKNTQTFTITEISKDSPAEKFGLKVGDKILAVDGKSLVSLLMLYKKLSVSNPGDKLELTIKRDDKEIKINLILDEYRSK